MVYKRHFILLGFLMLAAGMAAAATVQSFTRQPVPVKSLPTVEEKYTSFETAAYILMEQDGYVAIYASDPTRLVERTAIPVSGLRLADRELLARGITANNRRELLELLEDFNS